MRATTAQRGGSGDNPGARLSVLILILFLPLLAWGQASNNDSVERLRQTLHAPAVDGATRDRQIKNSLAQLRTLGDLGRALTLTEWGSERVEAIAAVDQANRALLLEHFTASVQDVLKRGEPNSILVTEDVLVELSKASRGISETKNMASVFGPELVRLLADGPVSLRVATARTLGQIEPDASIAVPALTTLLHDKDGNLRRAAASGLAFLIQGIIDSADRNHLTQQECFDKNVAIAATRGTIAAISDTLLDPYVEIRLESVRVATTCGTLFDRMVKEPPKAEQLDGPERDEIIKRFRADAEELRPLALSVRDLSVVLAGRLTETNRELRVQAYKSMLELARARWRWVKQQNSIGILDDDPIGEGLARAVPTLGNATFDSDVLIRRTSMEILELLGPIAAPALPGLTRALSDSDRFVRWVAVRTLGNLGAAARPALPQLTRCLGDADLDIRLAAATALEKVSPTPVTNDKHLPVQWAVDASKAGEEATLTALVKSLHATDAVMRLAALKTIRGMGPASLPALKELTGALKDADARVRQAAAETLGSLGPTAFGATEALKAALNDADPDVRRAVGDALLSVARP